MPARCNVLVLESERGAADEARAELTAAGHRVLLCHDDGAAVFPCNALAEGHRCPIHSDTVDVVLDVRPRPRSQPSAREDGVRCALTHHIPVLVAGPDVMSPYEDFAVTTVERTHGIVEACEEVARAPLPAHTAAADRALSTLLAGRGSDVPALVAVHRRHGSLVVEVRSGGAFDEATRSMASVRMIAAVREVDRETKGIDVVFQ